MAAYPTSPAFGYPLARVLEFKTEIATGEDGTEQRWALSTGEERWTLNYPRLTLAQRDTLISAFDAAKGSFDQTLTFDFDGATFTDVHFDSDRFSAVESSLGRWTVSVTLRQVVRGADTGELPADFPVLLTGARVQLPYTAERSFDNVIARTEGGRFGWYKRATPLRTWSAGGSVIDGNEAQAIFDQFRLAAGRLKSFGFTDPDSGTRYPNCRFASDTLEWRYLSKSVNEIRCQIQQFA
jgi:hypothetical protein